MRYILLLIITMSILSCSTTKQKIDVSTSETTSTKINTEDSSLLVRVVSDKINTSLNFSDFSKIKITYYSEKKDTTGNQIIDRIEERENNIIAHSKSDQKIIDSTNVKNNTKTNYQEDKKITLITKTKTKTKASPLIYITLIVAAVVLVAVIVRVSK
ncbi:hypothetical protein SDC9_112552 [bioreactor metagenome]|uniref:Uncharacterized protein n=1 Tax=bioreactor metagenome TaxID=1076179 RepID=A0A645BJV0_9ZZZZ